MSLIGSLTLGFSVAGLNAVSKGIDEVETKVGGLSGLAKGLGASALKFAAGFQVLSGIKDSISRIDEIGTMANRINDTAEALQGLRYAASQNDTANADLEKGLQKLNIKLGEAAAGSKAARDAFGDLRIDPDKISALPVTEAFAEVAGAIASLDPSQQAAAAVAIFGKSGASILPLLRRGSDGLRQLTAEAEALGLVISNDDVAAVKDATDSFEALKIAGGRAFDEIVIAGAPAASGIIDGLLPVFQTLGFTIDLIAIGANLLAAAFLGGLGLIVTGFTGLLDLVGLAPDALKIAGDALLGAAGQAADNAGDAAWRAEAAFNRIGSSVSHTADGINSELIPALEEVAKKVDELADKWRIEALTVGLSKDAAELYRLELQGATQEQLAGLRAAAVARQEAEKQAEAAAELVRQIEQFDKTLSDTADQWRLDLKAFGLEGRQREIFLLQQQGATDQELAPLRRLDEQLSIEENWKRRKEQAAQIREAFSSPLDDYQRRIDELNHLLAFGHLDEQTFAAASTDAFAKLADTIPKTQFAGAASFDSAEAFRTLAEAKFGSVRDPQEILRQVAERQLEQQQAQTALMQALVRQGEAVEVAEITP